MEYPPSLELLSEYVPGPPADVLLPLIELVKQHAPTVYRDCHIYGLDLQGDDPYAMIVAGSNYKYLGSLDELSVEMIRQMERYYKCQIGEATEEERKCYIAHATDFDLRHANMLADELANNTLFHGCKIYVYRWALVVHSGWWVGSFDVTTNADFIISNIRSHWNIYANTVDKLREFGCSVIEGFNAPYIISPVAMPVGAFETLDQEEKNALYVRLQYERWCEQTIVTVAGLLPQPIAEEICPHV